MKPRSRITYAGPSNSKAAAPPASLWRTGRSLFPFFDSRRIEHVEQALGLTPVERGVLSSPTAAAYTRTGLTTRPVLGAHPAKLFRLEDIEPESRPGDTKSAASTPGRASTGAETWRHRETLDYRLTHAKPRVQQLILCTGQSTIRSAGPVAQQSDDNTHLRSRTV